MKITEENINIMLAESIIMDYKFDLFSNELIFDLIMLESGKLSTFHVVFNNISALNYVYREGNMDKITLNAESRGQYNLEFTSITFLKNTEITFEKDGKEWLSQYMPKYNIAIEIGTRILLACAESITINDKKYTF